VSSDFTAVALPRLAKTISMDSLETEVFPEYENNTGAALGKDELKDEDEDKLIIIQKTETN